MFLSDVLKKEECRNEALQELRKLGIKCRPKKPKQQSHKNGKLFKVPLQFLPMETVTLQTGQQIAVPKLVHEMCSFILTKVSTEGLFRKEGSKARQGEMKLVLQSGGFLEKNIHVIDVAALLKTFLRELPEPLIPYTHHELFLRCILQDVPNKTQALLLACLLLPIEHLNTLTYLLQFFYSVADQSPKNKMTAYNLAVVISPAIFPLEEKLSQNTAQMRTSKICEIIQTLILNALEVGIIPESIIERLGSNSSTVVKKKKRRSGSLTRMFNGLKKIVGGKTVEENFNLVTPDLLLTPLNNNVMKKRRIQSSGISTKKKKEVLNKLPENVLLTTPFTPCRTPVSMDLSGQHVDNLKDTHEIIKEKKWFSRSRSLKNLNLKQENEIVKKTTKTILERRWSAINSSNNLKKTKKRNSFAATPTHKEKKIEELPEPDYIRVSKTEYEAIKNRVSAMERRISIELDNVQSHIKIDNTNNTSEEQNTNIKNVQTAYEQTLSSSQLSPTTDHLAKRLSRELKIRRSADQKIIRSPSARKIGSMRRRSLEKNSAKLSRHQSWHLGTRGSLKRGKPNTVSNGLPKNKSEEEIGNNLQRNVSCNLSGSSDTWTSAEGFFTTLKSTDSGSLSDRASLARLRSQNAGMVLAKAKLFDKLSDSESSSSLSLPRPKTGTKIGATRNNDSRFSYRIRSLKYEEKRLGKKSISPRRQLTQKHKQQIAKQYFGDKENIPDNVNRSDLFVLKDNTASPKYHTPKIKKNLNVREPKRLCRTPGGVGRGTPLRVLKTPQKNI